MAPNRGLGEYSSVPSLVNRSFLVPKLFNLFHSASLTTLMPFLPIYFRQLGMTAFQSGILGSFPGVVEVWSSPLWRLVSEKTNKRKCLLLLMILAGIVLNISLGLVGQQDAEFGTYKCEYGLNKTESNVGGDLLAATALMSNSTLSENNSSNRSSGPTRAEGANVLESETTSTAETFKTFQGSQHKWQISDKTLSEGSTNTSMSQPWTKQDSTGSEDWNTTRTMNITETWWYRAYGFHMNHTFKVLALLLFLCAFLTPISGITDSVFSDVHYWRKNSHAAKKVWISLGVLCGGGMIVLVVGQFNCIFGLQNSFYLHFYIFSFFGTGAFCFATLFQVSEPKAPLRLRFGALCKFLCCDMNLLCFMAVLWVVGIAESLISNFMMWYLQDIHASLTLMGLFIVVTALSEILMHGMSYYLVQWCGHHWVMFFSLIVYGGRFLCFSYIRNPFFALPVQLLHGLSYTASQSAVKSYATSTSLPGMEGAMQFLLSVIYSGLGRGFGGIAVALLYQLYGPVVVFRCAAGVCGMYSLCFACVQCLIILPDPAGKKKKIIQYKQVTFDDDKDDISHQVDWLLEALGEEELTEFTR